MAALALGASADGYKFEKVWELNTASIGIDKGNIRQGFGMNGKFYINDKSTQTVIVVDENGLTDVTYPGGRNCGITHDQAGNIVISDAAFPGNWVEAGIKVINPTTGETKDYVVPAECSLTGRCDFLGLAMGNMMEDGALFLTGKTPGTDPVVYTDGIAIFTVADGEVDMDNCYLASSDFLIGKAETNRDNMTVMNFYEDINGVPTLLYVYRSYSGNDVVKMPYYGDGFDEDNLTTVDLPNKGACAGTCPFLWDGKEFFVYPTLPNYFNGFAISEANAEEPLFTVPATVTASMNAFQSNWVNAEVDADGVTIYQYAPGANFSVYRLTKEAEEMVYTIVGDENVFGSNWDTNDENNELVMGEDGVYTWSKEGVTLYNGFEFKVVGNHDYATYEWPIGPYNWVANLPEGEGEGIYDILITFDPNADDENKITCTLTKVGDIEPLPFVIYTVVGPYQVFGTEWNVNDTNNDMDLDAETGLYTWSKNNIELTEDFGFKIVADRTFANEWPQGYGNNWIAYLPDGPGAYNIVITFNTRSTEITCTLTKVVVPAGMRGDVNCDQAVNIQDVTALINYLLSKNADGISLENADCDQSTSINISDVTALINYLLSKSW